MFSEDKKINDLQYKLNNHPIYDSIQTLEDLKCFVEHHIYSVWDFMSLVKYLQHFIAPSNFPWYPNSNGNLRRFINEIVLEEESDSSLIAGKYLSHFEIYQYAMEEIGADTSKSKLFIDVVKNYGIETALDLSIPNSAKEFIKNTFSYIESEKIHIIASAFTFGRETIIPKMFLSILEKLGVKNDDCPTFYYYINRHIEVDDIKHGPMALNLMNSICKNNQTKIEDAYDTAINAIESRIKFWDSVHKSIINQSESVLV